MAARRGLYKFDSPVYNDRGVFAHFLQSNGATAYQASNQVLLSPRAKAELA
jgi:hypothetical protein